MLDPDHLAALTAVHRRGSFELAALDLRVTPSAVSQRIKALEERIGALLVRRGQPCQATPAGLRLIRHFEEVSLLERGLAADLNSIVPGRTALRIAVNADSLATWVLPALAATEGFLFDVVIDDEGFSQEWLRRGEVAAAVTSEGAPLQGCDTVSLGAMRFVAAASPAFLARWMPEGPTEKALRQAPSLCFSEKDRLQARWVNAVTGGRMQKVSLPSHRIGSAQGFVDAGLAGLGWALHPKVLIAPHLRCGALKELKPGTPLDVSLYWQFSRVTAEPIKKLTAEIRKAARRVLRA